MAANSSVAQMVPISEARKYKFIVVCSIPVLLCTSVPLLRWKRAELFLVDVLV